MPYLWRKITRAKWEHRDGLGNGEIPADAVTADLRTMDNTLSFWMSEDAGDDGIRAIALVLATAADRVDRMDIVWVVQDVLYEHRLCLNRSDGRTPVAGLRSKHMDVANLDLGRLSTVAQLLAQALGQGQHRRLTKKEVVEIIVCAIRQHLVSLDELEPKVKEEIEKALVR